MARVGTLFLDDKGMGKATVKTLALRLQLEFMPIDGAPPEPNADKPTHDVFAIVAGGERVNIGAMWKRKARNGNLYFGVVLDDPSFDRKFFFTAHRNNVEVKRGEPTPYDLLWSREETTREAA